MVVDACEAAGAKVAALVTAALRRRIGDLSSDPSSALSSGPSSGVGGQAEAQGGAAPPAMPTVEAMVDDTLLNPNPNPNPKTIRKPNPNPNPNPNLSPSRNPDPNPHPFHQVDDTLFPHEAALACLPSAEEHAAEGHRGEERGDGTACESKVRGRGRVRVRVRVEGRW